MQPANSHVPSLGKVSASDLSGSRDVSSLIALRTSAVLMRAPSLAALWLSAPRTYFSLK